MFSKNTYVQRRTGLQKCFSDGLLLFLGNNDYSALPWMFICASLFTVVAAFIYLRIIEHTRVARRFQALLGLAVATFLALGVVVNIDPASLSLAIFTWVTGLGHL